MQDHTRLELADVSDPCIAVASLEYKEGKRVEALEAVDDML